MSSLRSNSSGTTKSTVTRATSTTTGGPKREQAYGAFKRLKDYMKEISEFETEYADFDKVIHERDAVINDLHAMEDKLEKKEREINLLKSCRKLDFEEFLAKTDNLKEELRQLVKKHSSEKQHAEKVLHSQQAKIASISTEVERAKDDIRLTKAQLEASNQELAQWRASFAHLRPLDTRDLETKIEELFHSCAQVAHNFMFPDLSTDMLNSHDAWEKGIKGLDISLRAPPSNSRPAKLMRVAVAMNVLANELVKTIFRPCLLLDSKEQSATMQETLEKHFQGNRKTRSFIHSQLISIHTRDDRRTVLHQWASTAGVNVSRKLSFMLPDGGAKFVAGSRDFFQCAADLWCDLQYVEDDIKIITADAYHFPEWGWEVLTDFGETTQSSEEVFMLFPGFYVPDRKVELFRGFALWKDQEQVAKADSEWKDFQKTRMPDLGRRSSAKNSAGRRYSTSMNGVPTPPTSPKSSMKEPHSRVSLGMKNK